MLTEEEREKFPFSFRRTICSAVLVKTSSHPGKFSSILSLFSSTLMTPPIYEFTQFSRILPTQVEGNSLKGEFPKKTKEKRVKES